MLARGGDACTWAGVRIWSRIFIWALYGRNRVAEVDIEVVVQQWLCSWSRWWTCHTVELRTAMCHTLPLFTRLYTHLTAAGARVLLGSHMCYLCPYPSVTPVVTRVGHPTHDNLYVCKHMPR